jgi:hypothetical protein
MKFFENSPFPLQAWKSFPFWILVLYLYSACENEPRPTDPTCSANAMAIERDDRGRVVSTLKSFDKGDSLAVRYRGDTAATVFRYARQDSTWLFERVRYELNPPQGPHFSYHMLPWSFNDTLEHRVRRYEVKNGRISGYIGFERYRQSGGGWQADSFARARITYDSLGRMTAFSSWLIGPTHGGGGVSFSYGPQAPQYEGSFPFLWGWDPVLGIWEGQETLPASSIGTCWMGQCDTSFYQYRGDTRLQQVKKVFHNSTSGDRKCSETEMIYR